MTIKKIKEEMLKWRDFFGGDLEDTERILAAKTKRELKAIMDDRSRLYEDMLADAYTFQRNFERKCGLINIY